MGQPKLPENGDIVVQLERLRSSPMFGRSGSLFSFLRFIVTETIEGRGDQLKELVVGDILYGRHSPYDPRIDSTVRVEARRLRRKLTEYYADLGALDAVRIELPTGSYRPTFSRQTSYRHDPAPLLRASSPGFDLAIMPFTDLSPGQGHRDFADGLVDEVIYLAERRVSLRIAPRLTVFQYRNRIYNALDAAAELDCSTILHGTVRLDRERARITLELIDKCGCVSWSDRVDETLDLTTAGLEALASQIVDGLPFDEVTDVQRPPRTLPRLSGWFRGGPCVEDCNPGRRPLVASDKLTPTHCM